MPEQIIICDLGGVLVYEAEINLLNALPSSIDFGFAQGKKRRIFNRMFELVQRVYQEDYKKPWIVGTVSGRDIVQKIHTALDQTEYDDFFYDEQEKNLIRYGSELVLLPDKLVALTELDVQGFEFLQQCQQQGLRLMILSNWDPASFALLKNKFPQLFSLFDEMDIILPAHAGYVKPEPAIFEYVMQHVQTDKGALFFIDDSPANILAGQKYGIRTVLHKNWEQTERELIGQGLKV